MSVAICVIPTAKERGGGSGSLVYFYNSLHAIFSVKALTSWDSILVKEFNGIWISLSLPFYGLQEMLPFYLGLQ